MSNDYRSDIPEGADERRKSDYRREGGAEWPEVCECLVGGEVVGERCYDANGALVQERPMHNGVLHGTCYFWDDGALTNAEPYFEGQMHGICKQWDLDGRLLGTYEMTHGTGLDVWRSRDETGRISVTEIHPMKDGKLHGFDQWFADEGKVYEETHFVGGRKHGIQRRWEADGLEEGYPVFWVDDRKVDREEYDAAAVDDPTLPPIREQDDLPDRDLPAGVE